MNLKAAAAVPTTTQGPSALIIDRSAGCRAVIARQVRLIASAFTWPSIVTAKKPQLVTSGRMHCSSQIDSCAGDSARR
jgi:hypothetical protein